MRTRSLLPTLLGLALATPLLHAGVILQNDFESESVGAFPSTGFTDINAQGIRVVEDDTSATPFGAGNQYLHLGGANLRVVSAIPGTEIDHRIKVAFDLVEPAGIGTSTMLLGFAANVDSLDLNLPNGAYVLSINNGTLATASNTSIESGTLPSLTEGEPYRLEFHLNRTGAVAEYPDPTDPANPPLTLDDGRVALWVKDLTADTWSGPVILTTTQAAAPREFVFRGFSTTNNEIYIDNFTVTDSGMWDGEAGDGLWATAANWDGDTVPAAGDPLVFGATPDPNLTNDLTAGTSFSGIRFLPWVPDYFIDGAAITLTGPVVSDASGAPALAFPITLGDDLELTVNSGRLFLDGGISGGFGLTKSGDATAILTNTNTYTGGTTVSEGTLQLGDGVFDGDVAGPIVNDAALVLQPFADLDFANDVSGTGGMRLVGPAIFRLTGTNTYSGETVIEDGVLLLDAGSDLPAGGALRFATTGGELDTDTRAITLGSLRANGDGNGTNTAVGSGSLTVNGGDLLVGPGSGSVPGDSITLDLSGLASFTFDNAAGFVSVSNQVPNANNRSSTLTLADQSMLTAERIRVQERISGTSSPCSSVLELGADTTFHTDEIEVAHSGRDSGLIRFRTGLTGGALTLRATDGTGRAAIDIGRRGSSVHPSHNVGIDLISGDLDARVSGLEIGNIGFGNNVTQNAFFRMGGGTLDANSILLGTLGNGGGSNGTLNSTFSVDGGEAIAPTVTFGNNTSPDSNLFATFELNSGSLTATTLQAGSDGTGESQRTLELGGGTLRNTPGADLGISGITVAIPADASPALVVESGRTATLGSGMVSFGIDGSTASAGSLTVTGDLTIGPGMALMLEDASADSLPVGTTLTLIDYTGGTLVGIFEDADGNPINDGDTLSAGATIYQIDYDDDGAVTLSATGAVKIDQFVYNVSDRLTSNTAMSNDGWTGDDLENWIASFQFNGNIYARNENGGDDRITRNNDAEFGYAIPANATSLSLEIVARASGAYWEAALTASGANTLGLGYDGPNDKFFIIDGATRIDEPGITFSSGDINVTVRLDVDLTTGTADLIFDPAGSALVMIEDAPIDVTAAALTAADGLATRCTSKFSGVGRYALTVTSSPGGGGSPYETWAAGFALDPLGNGAPGEDPDGDGKSNLIEFATNDNPTSGAASGKLAGLVQDVGGEAVLTYTLPVRGSGTPFSGATEQVSDPVDGVVYRIQGSDDLGDWTSMVISEIAPALDAGLPPLNVGWEYRTFRTPGTVADNPTRFIRAVIEAAP